MAISGSGKFYEEKIGGETRRLLLRNGEIERFEVQHATKIVDGIEVVGVGIFELFDQLFGRGPAPQARHVRDLIALGLVGAGMTDRAADDLISAQSPAENLHLRQVAQRLLGVTFIPSVLDAPAKKRGAGSRKASPAQPEPTTMPEDGSKASAV